MNFCNIHTSQLVSLKTFNIRTLLFKDISNLVLEKKYYGITFNAFKFKPEILKLKFNKNYVFVKNSKFKITQPREFDILCLISKYKSFEKLKSHHFFLINHVKNWLFPSKVKNKSKDLSEYFNDVKSLFANDKMENNITVFFVKYNTFFADQVK